MSGSKKYYSTIYQRFRKAVNKQKLVDKDESDKLNHTELDDDINQRYEYAETLIEQYTWNQRDAKNCWSYKLKLSRDTFKKTQYKVSTQQDHICTW